MPVNNCVIIFRMSVAICSILAAKISTEQTSELGSHASYMKKLLSIVRTRMQENHLDITLKFTLSALWNLTDESPKTCKGDSNQKLFDVKVHCNFQFSLTRTGWSYSWMSSTPFRTSRP